MREKNIETKRSGYDEPGAVLVLALMLRLFI